jgi:hypothetical protein
MSGESAECRVVELGHEFTVSGAGGVEFFLAFLQLEAQVDDLLLEAGGLLAELVEVGSLAEAALPPGLLAEGFG